MLSALLILWLISLPLVLPFAGYSLNAPFTWHPASLIASALVLGNRRLLGLASAIALVLLGLGAHGLANPWSGLCMMLFLAAAIPLPFFFVDVIRRDRTLKNVHYVFWNAASPLAIAQERRILEGQSPDTIPQVAFYIGAADWPKIPHVSQEDKNYLARFHRGGGLYVAPATNSFLQAFDGLQLHPFILNSDNASALKAFEQALKTTAPAPVPITTLPSAPVSPPAMTPPPTAWHALARKLPKAIDEEQEPDEDEPPVTVEEDRKHSRIDQILAPPVPPTPNPAENAPPPMAKQASKPGETPPPRTLKINS